MSPSSEVQVSVRTVSQCAVLDIDAENFTYPHTGVLKNQVNHLLQEGRRQFVFNFERVRLVDSYGLASIIATLKLIREHHGALALCGLNDIFHHLVEVTHLERVLEIWPSEAQAVYDVGTRCKSA